MGEANGLHQDTSGMERRIEVRVRDELRDWLREILDARDKVFAESVKRIEQKLDDLREDGQTGDGRVWQIVVFALGGALGLITSVSAGVAVYFITR